MKRKVCFKCGRRRSITMFYKHPMMADGHLGKCKDCTKHDMAMRRVDKIDEIRAYDKRRCQTPERKAKMLEYQRTRRVRHRDKCIAWSRLAYAVRTGKIVRQPCEVCGDPKTQGHHEDYSKPLDVRWLCFKHHREAHGQTVAD